MLTPFEKRPLPRVSGPENTKSLLTSIVDMGLPGFVLESSGMDFVSTYNMTTATLEDTGITLNRRVSQTHRQNGNYAFKSLYFDNFANIIEPDPPTTIDFWHVRRGLIQAHFFVPTPEFAQSYQALPPDTHQLFQRGVVDSEVLQPYCFSATATPTDTLVFQRGGRQPTVHYFETIGEGYSHTWSADHNHAIA